VVPDASALIDFVLRTERFETVEGTIVAGDADLHVPELCDLEALAFLRRSMLVGALSDARAEEALEDYTGLPLTRHGHETFLGRIFELRSNFSPYDAVYVALAERLTAPILTTDYRLARAVRDNVGVPVLPDRIQ
jgi:predicted nucleic acid-binding protein